MCYILSENILVKKYQVAILFPWTSERPVNAINRLYYKLGPYLGVCKTQHFSELYQAALLFV